MIETNEQLYGQLALTNILASVWLGDWDRYEEIFAQLTEEMKEHFQFHSHYEREDVTLWHENYFNIPGDYFVSPYYSSYTIKKDGGEEGKRNLLCLIGMYERLGFYFPLQQDLYPDHIGCLTTFLAAVLQEKIKAAELEDRELFDQLTSLEREIVKKYIIPVSVGMKHLGSTRMQNPFFEQFLPFYVDVMKEPSI